MAYCLLDLFNVNMPLLYGEGRKAFDRLVQEIRRTTDDDSIFAWTSTRDSRDALTVLPDWPDKFTNSKYVHSAGQGIFKRPPFTLTNQGLSFPVAFRSIGFCFPSKSSTRQIPTLRIPLNCGICSYEGFASLVLEVARIDNGSPFTVVRKHSFQFMPVDRNSGEKFQKPSNPTTKSHYEWSDLVSEGDHGKLINLYKELTDIIIAVKGLGF